MGVREGEARRLGEGAGCGTTVPLRSHEWVGPARWVPPRGATAAASGSDDSSAGSQSRGCRNGWELWASGPGGMVGTVGRSGEAEVGSAGFPGSEFSPGTGTSLLLDWFSAQSSAAGQELESRKLKGASKSHLCQTDSRRNSDFAS